ncbi:hypothetical protein DUNSADRAFT_16281 [Dunaliella salina]|uniref:F-box domain-containing protein n=1 Tax=Dunaliella salina TaxID=3046 RepID=A0ABQ7G410_DUNSA|nr:hypothetical protein DUNSADRAFT_16281 [Dunaliella salina]|eukprot:KAF5829300.1 hypothetical protein DUNSADRAFT_16281 [Dunaliella salina]
MGCSFGKMPHEVGSVPGSSESSSDHDSDENELVLDEVYKRYLKLELRQALALRQFRVQACHELAACLPPDNFRQPSKRCQAAMAADALRAVEVCDRRPQCIEATQQVVKAAEKVLPQQKRSEIQAEFERKMQSLARADCKGKGMSAENSNSEEAASDVPIPDSVMHIILARLDPVSLARASCVCRSWHVLGSAPDLWYFWEHTSLFPHTAARTPEGQSKASAASFGRLLAEYPQAILPFKTGRIMKFSKPGWLHPDATCHMFHTCMFQRQRRQLQQRQRQQEMQKRPEGEAQQQQQPLNVGQAQQQQQQQEKQQQRRVKIGQESSLVQPSIPGHCYPPSLYCYVTPCSIQQAFCSLLFTAMQPFRFGPAGRQVACQ